MKVVIAEKPSMGRDIARILGADKVCEGYRKGNGYRVTWAVGHLVEIHDPLTDGKWQETPLPVMGNFVLRPKEATAKQLKVIEALFKDANEIINAGDAGREGELIQRYIYHYLNCKKPVKRLWISSLTDAAIKDGFANLKDGSAYDTLYDAARARSEADYRVGINATRALTLAVNNTEVFSLGRVQTPTMAMVCKRFLDNKNFVPQPFWTIVVKTEKDYIAFTCKPKENYSVKSNADADLQKIGTNELQVNSVETKERQEKPPLLYDLTALQKAANQKHGMTPDSVLQIAQSLYESKYLSYPRTGSCYIPDDVFATIPKLIAGTIKIANLGMNTDYYSNNPALSKGCVDGGKVTDHHALLPTDNTPDLEQLTKPERTIYTMVAGRMLEAFHGNCVKDVTDVKLTAGGVELFAKGTVVKTQGWREILGKEVKEADDTPDKEKDAENALPALHSGDILPNMGAELKEDKTKPLPLLTDATLLAYMETAGKDIEDEQAREAMKEGGLGTPATRDSIIKSIIDRGYVMREKKKLLPTDKGLAAYEIIKDKLIASPALTGDWEKKMSGIQTGTLNVETFLGEIRDFTEKITAELRGVEANIKSAQDAKNEAMPMCPKCKTRRLHIFEKGIGCAKECGFVVWRTIAGKTLTDKQLAALVEKGATGEIKGFTSKAGKEFSAKLKLDAEWKTVFDFNNKKS
jgi:DNA topoisomerase-3